MISYRQTLRLCYIESMQTTRQEQDANEAAINVALMQEDLERLQSYLSEDMSDQERREVLKDIRDTKVALVRWSNEVDAALDELFS
jgi:hypothetical protein